jgi:hypothetical protein
MMIAPVYRKLIVARLAVLLLALLALHTTPTFGQNGPERFWLAGRYDGNRVVVYFDAVKFEGTMSSNAREIADPVAGAFFNPVELPASYIARFQKTPNAEHFAIGDRYDLLLGNGTIATIKLTTLVGCETDEQVGNDSFIGALGTIEKKDALVFTNNYYAVRRHQEPQTGEAKLRPKTTSDYLKYAHLDDQPVRFDIETRIAEMLNERMKMEATDAERRLAGSIPPSFKVQPFRVADSSLRYYVRAEWRSGKEPKDTAPYVLAAWMTPLPTLHILAVQKRTSPYDGFESDLPDLLNVVDLGNGKTGMIVQISGLDSTELHLVEYRDAADLKSMHLMQSIGTGE